MHCSLANELKSAGWKEFLEDSGDVSVGLVRHLTLSSQSLQDVGVLVSKMIQIELLEFTNIDGLNLIEVSSYTGIEHTYLLFSWHWHILSLLKNRPSYEPLVTPLPCPRPGGSNTAFGASAPYSPF